MTRHRPGIGRLALVALLAVAAATGCDNEGDNVQTRAPEQATTQVKQYAYTARTAVGVDAFSQANENVTPCEGRAGELSDPDDVYYIQGNYQILVPAEGHADALARAREQWQRDGLTIESERTFGAGGTGEVQATTHDGYDLTLTSGEPPAMLLAVASACYRR